MIIFDTESFSDNTVTDVFGELFISYASIVVNVQIVNELPRLLRIDFGILYIEWKQFLYNVVTSI